jgi:alkanesulfonate monooxygenase SsuD/methylene tetrahydromethanopterin reductase-like flavin-dependent oxidoreductase (luciferase family)
MTSMPPATEPPALKPLGRGSVSLRIYPLDLPPRQIVTDLALQALLAEEAGFDGCMFAEHHGGFPNYLPNPLLAATWALEGTNRIWAAPCPLLLPLRPVTQVVEDLVWSHHRFPGRVGVGVGAGSFPVDFDMAGVPLAELFPRYRQALAVLT